MNEFVNPDTVRAPGGAYSHTVKIPANAEWLMIAGQAGVNVKGEIQSGIHKQAEQVFRNINACLRAHKMNKKDLVKLTVFLTDSRYIDDYRAARKKVIGEDFLPASTLLIVDGLASPDLLIEIEATAAKA
ncbi:MAG: enamine deaminase RidA (YjgF/YER057c/UK114 family) [Alphaproteobacteria bacterium]|jgi:2-iminobutanoate/2-iminopropanoate deaminase